MITFNFDKIVEVRRKQETLGAYNRPQKEFTIVGEYGCHTAEGSTNTSQKEPQKLNITELNLYTYPDADIKKGDVLFIYDKDEYEEKILESEFKAIADKPYKKRTHLRVHLISEAEV